jgi:hypothetical protein
MRSPHKGGIVCPPPCCTRDFILERGLQKHLVSKCCTNSHDKLYYKQERFIFSRGVSPLVSLPRGITSLWVFFAMEVAIWNRRPRGGGAYDVDRRAGEIFATMVELEARRWKLRPPLLSGASKVQPSIQFGEYSRAQYPATRSTIFSDISETMQSCTDLTSAYEGARIENEKHWHKKIGCEWGRAARFTRPHTCPEQRGLRRQQENNIWKDCHPKEAQQCYREANRQLRARTAAWKHPVAAPEGRCWFPEPQGKHNAVKGPSAKVSKQNIDGPGMYRFRDEWQPRSVCGIIQPSHMFIRPSSRARPRPGPPNLALEREWLVTKQNTKKKGPQRPVVRRVAPQRVVYTHAALELLSITEREAVSDMELTVRVAAKKGLGTVPC